MSVLAPLASIDAGRLRPVRAETIGPKPNVRVINMTSTSGYVFEDLVVSDGMLNEFKLAVESQSVADGTRVTKVLLAGTADVSLQSGFAPVIDAGASFRIIGGAIC